VFCCRSGDCTGRVYSMLVLISLHSKHTGPRPVFPVFKTLTARGCPEGPSYPASKGRLLQSEVACLVPKTWIDG
jgi:hypothetical protein